jgi:hypothetical protein
MDHFIPCSCGDGVFVPETAAGSTAACPCGRSLTVPSFRELRRLAGQQTPEPSPELVIEALLLARQLPDHRDCVLCGKLTDHSVCYRTICERAEVETGGRPLWQILLAAVTLSWLGGLVVAADRRPERELGRDKIYELPLRACENCAATLTVQNAVKRAMLGVPVYRRLLAKFPDAVIEMPGLTPS